MENKDQEGSIMDDLDLDGQKRPGPAEQIEGALPDSKLKIIRSLLENIKASTQAIEKMLSGDLSEDLLLERIRAAQMPDPESDPQAAGRIIEGVFDGENMIGPDGKQYSVPANYASKSKLVEGDILKLTITATGTFVYKQINPAERKRLVGELRQDATGSFFVLSEGRQWRALTASVTYFKGQSGDEAVILVPKTGESKWAAVENVVKKQF